MNSEHQIFYVEMDDSGARLDQFISKKLPEVSRSFLQKKI